MLSEALRLIRIYHDMKQTELSDALDISRPYISEIESGKKEPSLEIIKKYSKHFDIPVSSILFFSENLEGQSSEKIRSFLASNIIKLLQFIEDKGK